MKDQIRFADTTRIFHFAVRETSNVGILLRLHGRLR